VAKTQENITALPNPDLLAAVVLHTLVTQGRDGMTPAQVARICERDPSKRADIEEIETALELLLDDGLAERRRMQEGKSDEHEESEREQLVRPTRAAIRADELSF
jgi:hypothetical protein